MPASLLATAFLLALLWPSASRATLEPIIFDFEDGLQGWELHGSAQRVQTQILGGEWAIFGDGFLRASIIRATDPMPIRSISVEMILVDGEADNLLLRFEGQLFRLFEPFRVIEPGNPFLLSVEFGAAGRVIEEVEIRWLDQPIRPGPLEAVGFIDNITFHPIPEPKFLGILGLIAVLAMRRARQKQRSA